jgi:hypothetical protein
MVKYHKFLPNRSNDQSYCRFRLRRIELILAAAPIDSHELSSTAFVSMEYQPLCLCLCSLLLLAPFTLTLPSVIFVAVHHPIFMKNLSSFYHKYSF